MSNISHQNYRKADGFVSIFSVIFFMMLLTIITLGFLRIMAVEERQALDNDLSSSALASAESGVEEAKRALIKYSTIDPADPQKAYWRGVLSSSACNAVLTDPTISTALKFTSGGAVTGETNINQYETCLTVNLNSPDFAASSTASKSEFIPLKPQGGQPFDRIVVSWHLLSGSAGPDGDGTPASYPITQALPPVTGSGSSWASRGYPAYLRVELYGYPNSGTFTRSDIDARSHSIFLVPNAVGSAGAISSTTPIAMDVADPRGMDQSKVGVQGIQCAASGSYACTATLALPAGLPSSGTNYYLRVTPLYGSTHFDVQLQKSGSGVVNFSEVEPIIDVTGRTADVFRRVQTRVRLDTIGQLPEYTVESVNTICKNMQVSEGSYFQPNNCP